MVANLISPKFSIQMMQYYTMHQLHLNYRCEVFSIFNPMDDPNQNGYGNFSNMHLTNKFHLIFYWSTIVNQHWIYILPSIINPTMHFKKTSHTSIQHLIFQNYNGCSTNHHWSNKACLKKAQTQLSKVDLNFV